jgi:hypothetical protein
VLAHVPRQLGSWLTWDVRHPDAARYTKDKNMNLSTIIDALEKIDAASVDNGVSRHFLEVVKTGAKREEITIRGNREGLIYLALKCLDLALRKNEGSHHHFDEVSMLDTAEAPLVIAYKSAAWDDEKTA